MILFGIVQVPLSNCLSIFILFTEWLLIKDLYVQGSILFFYWSAQGSRVTLGTEATKEVLKRRREEIKQRRTKWQDCWFWMQFHRLFWFAFGVPLHCQVLIFTKLSDFYFHWVIFGDDINRCRVYFRVYVFSCDFDLFWTIYLVVKSISFQNPLLTFLEFILSKCSFHR